LTLARCSGLQVIYLRAPIDEEGVGETSGQTAGSNFRFSKTGPAEETSFLRSLRTLMAPQFHRGKTWSRSGPDVFADALVHPAGGCARLFHFPTLLF
jgi:hypothetical protein